MEKKTIDNAYIGRYVIVRSDLAGIFVGKLEIAESVGNIQNVLLLKMRHIDWWEGAMNLMEMSLTGVVEGSRVTQEVESGLILGCCEVLPLTDAAQKYIYNQPLWKKR